MQTSSHTLRPAMLALAIVTVAGCRDGARAIGSSPPPTSTEVRGSGEPRVALTPIEDGRLRVRIRDQQQLLWSARASVTLQSDDGPPEIAGIVESVAEPITIAFLVCGSSVWIGSDEIPDKDFINPPGALRPLQAAIDKLGLADSEHPESKFVMLTYGRGVEIVASRKRLQWIKGSLLGEQSTYAENRGNLLLQGIATALDQLEEATTPRKALIVVGDGRDDTLSQLAPSTLARRARDGHIHMHSIIWKVPHYKDDRNDVNEVIPSPIVISSTNEFGFALEKVSRQFPRTYDLIFDGASMSWDGRPHRYVLRNGDEVLARFTATLPSRASDAPEVDEAAPSRWPWGLFAVGIVGVGIGFGFLLGRRVASPVARQDE